MKHKISFRIQFRLSTFKSINTDNGSFKNNTSSAAVYENNKMFFRVKIIVETYKSWFVCHKMQLHHNQIVYDLPYREYLVQLKTEK